MLAWKCGALPAASLRDTRTLLYARVDPRADVQTQSAQLTESAERTKVLRPSPMTDLIDRARTELRGPKD